MRSRPAARWRRELHVQLRERHADGREGDADGDGDNQTKAYGAANPALTVSYSGFVNGDTAASLTTPATVSTTATAASAPGTYPITASGATSVNYTFTYVNGTLTVTTATLTVTANSQTKASTARRIRR